MSIAYKTIATASGTNSYTGSIAKLVAIGASGTAGDASVSRIEFGAMTYPESYFTASSVITTTVKVPAGSTIDGPIARFTNAAGSFLIYFDA
tara:strand:+ start:313 stop:588 length:276 start_codon:yes stop_codon:yes gene_type:complete